MKLRALSGRNEILTLTKRDVQFLIWALDDLRVWFGPAFHLAGFRAEEAGDFVHRFFSSLPDWKSTAAAQPVDLIVDDDLAVDVNDAAGGAATSWQVHLTHREWELLKSSLGKFLEIDGTLQDFYPEILAEMENLDERLSAAV